MVMGSVKLHSPLLLQSKLLCLSLLYLLTTLPLSIYVSFSQTGCLFAGPSSSSSSLSNPQPLLFSYPKSYGEHKYAIPTARASCTSNVLFSEYEVAFQEIHDVAVNASSQSPALRYNMGGGGGGGRGESFAGNFSTERRKSYFNHTSSGGDNETEIPCGFFKEFPIKHSDRLAMENCSGVVVASAIFGDHDKLRQPKGLGARTLETVCFFMFIDDITLKSLHSHKVLSHIQGEVNMIGAWKIVRVPSDKLPYNNLAMNGVVPKHLMHRFFPKSKFSIWVDAKLQLTVDPLLLIHSLVISKDVDMALSKHPFNIHTMEEAMATARWKKWGDVESLRLQMETYCENGLQPWTPSKLPYTTDVPDTALIARRHGFRSNLFSCLLFNELEAFNPRDQLAFAYVRDLMTSKIKINLFEVEVFEQVAVEYRHNIKREGPLPPPQQTRRGSSREISGSSCEGYLLKMWGESTDSEN